MRSYNRPVVSVASYSHFTDLEAMGYKGIHIVTQLMKS
jgi:hypothetical protein